MEHRIIQHTRLFIRENEGEINPATTNIYENPEFRSAFVKVGPFSYPTIRGDRRRKVRVPERSYPSELEELSIYPDFRLFVRGCASVVELMMIMIRA